MAARFLDVFEETASVILSFLYEWEIFGKVELLCHKINSCCKDSQRWAELAAKYSLPGANQDVLRQCTITRRPGPCLMIGRGEALTPIPIESLPTRLLHEIVRSMVPGLHAFGAHHENDGHWPFLSSTGEGMLFRNPEGLSEVMENRLTPFDVFPYCRSVCWYECHSKIRLQRTGLWGIFWRMSLRLSEDLARESTWDFKLSVTDEYGHEAEACRKLSGRELFGLKAYDWIDFLIGTVYVGCPTSGPVNPSTPLDKPLNITVSVVNINSTTGRSGHIYDFVHAWPMATEDKAPELDTGFTIILNGSLTGVSVNHALRSSEVFVLSDPQWRRGRRCYRW